jgi:Fe-S-cluster containining protein
MSKTKISNKQRLKAVYDSLPTINCKKLCQASCGLIPVNRLELRRMQAATDTDLQKHATHIDSRKTVLFNLETTACPALGANGDCTVHEARPLLCRLFGVVPQMRCPHGCIPDRWLTPDEALALFKEFEELR